MRRILMSTAMGVLLVFSAGTAQAQYDNRALYDRLDRLERDLQIMQSQSMRGGSTVITSPAMGGGVSRSGGSDSPMPAGLATRLDERVDQLEEMVRQLTGKVEEANFKSQQVSRQLERMQADLDLRFKDLQAAQQNAAPASSGSGGGTAAASTSMAGAKGGDAPPPPNAPQTLGTLSDKDLKKPGAPVPTPTKSANDAQAQYDAAYTAAQSGDYPAAERGFQEFLAKNPSHQLAGNAQYWLGDIAFTRKDYDTAAATFLDAYKKFPKHGKAPDMIYKAGSAFGLKGKKKEACTAFSILFANHPDMPDRVKRAATVDRQKYDCK